ncbi:MAG: RDD family protein [Actinoplanes sp.]
MTSPWANNPDVRVTGRRIVATIVDSLVLTLAYRLITGIFDIDIDYSSDIDFTTLNTPAGIGWLIFAVAYYVLMESFLGRTVSKMVTGIRVVDARTGTNPGIFTSLIRTLLRVIDGLGGYLLGFLVVVFGDRRRRIGDLLANTQVVRS